MASTIYHEDDLFSVDESNGKADKENPSTNVEVLVSNFFDDHQIYLKMTIDGKERTFHLTKKQAEAFSVGLESASTSIGYDNR